MATKSKKKILVSEEVKTAGVTISSRKLLIAGACLLVAVLVISFTVPRMLSKGKGKSAEANKIIISVEKMLLLPDESDPTVIEVSNVAKLKKANAEFYKEVEKGDYILMYSEKAVIYRKSNKQIINVAPITSKDDKNPENPNL